MENFDQQNAPEWMQQFVQACSIMAQQAAVQQAITRHPQQPTKILGPLSEYDGNRDTLDAWIHQARGKLRVDYAACDEATKFYAVYNRLRDEAMRQLQPWVQLMEEQDAISANTIGPAYQSPATVEGLFNQLLLSFGDPHRKEKAQRKLYRLRQGNRPFSEFFVDFQKLLLESKGTTWDDDSKKTLLEQMLNQDLAQHMIGKSGMNQTFNEYVEVLKEVSDQLEAYQARVKSTNWRQRHQALQQSPQPHTRTMPTENNWPNTKVQSGPHTSGNTMDWQPTVSPQIATGKRAKWVTKEEILRRSKEGLCRRCGARGHFQTSCPYLPARPLQVARTAARAEEPLLEDDLSELEEVKSEN